MKVFFVIWQMNAGIPENAVAVPQDSMQACLAQKSQQKDPRNLAPGYSVTVECLGELELTAKLRSFHCQLGPESDQRLFAYRCADASSR